MKPTKKVVTLFIAILWFTSASTLLGTNVKIIPNGKLKISNDGGLLLNPKSFCVTQDSLFLIPDLDAGNVKIYEKKGRILKLVKTIENKGFSNDALADPTLCFYDKVQSKFGVYDQGLRKIILFDRIGRLQFKRDKSIYCLRGLDQMRLSEDGNKLLIAGTKVAADRTIYEFYSIDLENDEPNFILSAHEKFDMANQAEFISRLYETPDLLGVEGIGRFACHKNQIYFARSGDIKVRQLSDQTNEKKVFFGKTTKNYRKPFRSKRLSEAYQLDDSKLIRNEWDKMSFVRHVFTSSKHIILIYEGPIRGKSSPKFRMQFYDFNRNFIKELPIPGRPASKMWFDKEKNVLYSLSNSKDTKREGYFISVYLIQVQD